MNEIQNTISCIEYIKQLIHYRMTLLAAEDFRDSDKPYAIKQILSLKKQLSHWEDKLIKLQI